MDVKVKDFVERVVTINELPTCFPNASPTVPAAKILDNKIPDLLESAIPITWQRHMVLQGFDPMDRIIADLSNFCECIELTKDLPLTKKPNHKKTGKGQDKNGKKGVKKHKTKGQGSSFYQCMLHGPNKTHNTEDCYALKNLVKGTKNGKKYPRQKIQEIRGN